MKDNEFMGILKQIALPSTTETELIKFKDNLDSINTRLTKIFNEYIDPKYFYKIDILEVEDGVKE